MCHPGNEGSDRRRFLQPAGARPLPRESARCPAANPGPEGRPVSGARPMLQARDAALER